MRSSKTIYILEDDTDIRSLVRYLLVSEGYNVFDFENAHDFYEKVNENPPDLFILDVSLPDGNGLEITKYLIMHEQRPIPPIVVMSADAGNKNGAMLSGARIFIPKPFDIHYLLSTVSQLLAA